MAGRAAAVEDRQLSVAGMGSEIPRSRASEGCFSEAGVRGRENWCQLILVSIHLAQAGPNDHRKGMSGVTRAGRSVPSLQHYMTVSNECLRQRSVARFTDGPSARRGSSEEHRCEFRLLPVCTRL